MAKWKKIILWMLGIVLTMCVVVGASGYSYINHLLGKIEAVDINKDEILVNPEANEKLSKYEDNIINIALFGIDSSEGVTGRSDTIMIATIDTKEKKIKLTSIMRDSYVNIEGYGYDKINHAYAFGGPELAINTINTNFDLNIKDFVTVSFSSMPKIIDKIGGIELDIEQEEIQYINEYIDKLNISNGTNSPYISTVGKQDVDGTQAMAYCRVRYTSGGDYKRTERQREVLTTMFNKVINLPVTKFPELLGEILPMGQTNLDSSTILELATEVVKMGIPMIEQERFPVDGYCQGEFINDVYYLTFDKEETIHQMYSYIFENKKIW